MSQLGFHAAKSRIGRAAEDRPPRRDEELSRAALLNERLTGDNYSESLAHHIDQSLLQRPVFLEILDAFPHLLPHNPPQLGVGLTWLTSGASADGQGVERGL